MQIQDTRLWRVFVTLAQTNSFTRAAGQLNLTQSAVSHAMKRLEGQLGCTLFYQKGKTTHLTPEGRLLLSQALRILDAWERAAQSVSARFSDSQGKLHVIFTASMAHLILAPVLREFRESYPRISLVVRLEDTPRAREELEEGRCDLALLLNDRLPAGLKTRPLFSDRLELVFSPLHPWARQSRITARDLSKQHFLLYNRTSTTFRRIESFFLKAGVQLSSYVEIPSFEVIKEMVKLGLGVAFMAPWAAGKELAEGSLLSRPTPRFAIRRERVVAHQRERGLRQPEQTFVGLCRMVCETVMSSE